MKFAVVFLSVAVVAVYAQSSSQIDVSQCAKEVNETVQKIGTLVQNAGSNASPLLDSCTKAIGKLVSSLLNGAALSGNLDSDLGLGTCPDDIQKTVQSLVKDLQPTLQSTGSAVSQCLKQVLQSLSPALKNLLGGIGGSDILGSLPLGIGGQ